MIGRHPAMLEVYRQVRLAARGALPVVVVGETGTGKELVAHALHELSAVSRGPFVDINCAAVPEGLAEAELFGSERGAFTGAVRPIPGLLEIADGGTLMLDEAGSLPVGLQAKLLRAIEQQDFRRVGGRERRHSRFRLVTVVARPIRELVGDGTFRPDFAQRVSGFTVTLPPLRERARDVAILAQYFLGQASRNGDAPKQLAPEAVRLLHRYAWPGNVRELRMLFERLAVAVDGAVIDLPAVLLELPGVDSSHDPTYLAGVLAALGWDFTKAARALGIHRATLYRRIRELGITRPKVLQVSHATLPVSHATLAAFRAPGQTPLT